MKGYLILAILTIAYMAVEYWYRGYFAFGAEIMVVPLALMVLCLRKELEDD